MAGQSMIGPIQVEFRQQGHRVVMSLSGDRETVKRVADGTEVIKGVQVPCTIELDTSGGAHPDFHARVELRDGSPVLTELSFKSRPGQKEIQQKHLRDTNIGKLVTDLVASTIQHSDVEEAPPLPKNHDELVAALRERKRTARQGEAAARRFVDRQRLPPTRRVMTPEFLQRVAEVYRENIKGNPTEAVAAVFNVKSRMASKYVQAARQRGYLPPTKRGQKKA